MLIVQLLTLKIQVLKIYVWHVTPVAMNVQVIQLHALHVIQTIIYMSRRVD